MKESSYVAKKASFFTSKAFLTTLVGLFFISLMVFSVLDYGSSQTGQKKVKYKGLSFTQTTEGWQAYAGDKKIVIQANPELFGDESVSSAALDRFIHSSLVYISLNPYDSVQGAVGDFQRNVPIGGVYALACSGNYSGCEKYPVKTCADASPTEAVVLFQTANESLVSLDGTCLTIQGKDLLSVTDMLILSQYGEQG
ncbi:hypothetical protein HZA98_00545 [Candidatus Woesearchaeota archaeon]|nr:hypothetical protein [Candidatus Woesearchaeota archaeon]